MEPVGGCPPIDAAATTRVGTTATSWRRSEAGGRHGSKGLGTVRRLPSGRHQARYPDDSGKQVPAPHTLATKADDNQRLAKVQTELESGGWIDPKAGRESLEVYAERWVDTRLVRGRPLAPRTAELYRAQLKNHIVSALESTALRRLDGPAHG